MTSRAKARDHESAARQLQRYVRPRRALPPWADQAAVYCFGSGHILWLELLFEWLALAVIYIGLRSD